MEAMRRTIFRMQLNAEHVQGCKLAVIEMATADSCASGTESEAANKEFEEASIHAFIIIDLDLLDLEARVVCSEHLQARKGWQLLPASSRVSRVQRYRL